VTGVALITGAARGIGAACATHLANQGMAVALLDRDGAGAQERADELRAAGANAIAVPCDVTSSSEVSSAVDRVVAELGPLTAAVNSAGINLARHGVSELGDDEWAAVLAVNLTGVMYCVRAEVQAMRASGGGSIVNIGSMLSTVAYPNAAAYVSTKHAVLGLTRSAAIDHAREGIRVNLVAPGHVRTDFGHEAMTDEKFQALSERYPRGAIAESDDIAALVAFLCSDGARNITGACLASDGGYTAQ